MKKVEKHSRNVEIKFCNKNIYFYTPLANYIDTNLNGRSREPLHEEVGLNYSTRKLYTGLL